MVFASPQTAPPEKKRRSRSCSREGSTGQPATSATSNQQRELSDSLFLRALSLRANVDEPAGSFTHPLQRNGPAREPSGGTRAEREGGILALPSRCAARTVSQRLNELVPIELEARAAPAPMPESGTSVLTNQRARPHTRSGRTKTAPQGGRLCSGGEGGIRTHVTQ